jgi:A/G-specific adenine glycosylase
VRTLTTVPPAARDAILAWFHDHSRPLAFRQTRDPYAILVSETMAQQTQASRAAAYWERFIGQFPTLEALAAATPATVLRTWQGLGYDRRALALWRTARIVVDDHHGRLPSTVAELQALPGVGPYTARAVAAIAFGLPVGAVDVNVRRVLGRIVAGDAAVLPAAAVQRLADDAVPAERPADWTHALMDIGATICRGPVPRCEACPVRRWCRFAATRQSSEKAERGVRGGANAARPGSSAASTRARVPAPRFSATNRWLRGRILDRLRAAPDGEWVALDAAIGSHELERVRVAAGAMAADGLLELSSAHAQGATLWARLPLA